MHLGSVVKVARESQGSIQAGTSIVLLLDKISMPADDLVDHRLELDVELISLFA